MSASPLMPQIEIGAGVVAAIIFLFILYKLWTKIWLYVVLSSPSWSITIFNVINDAIHGKVAADIVNDGINLVFFLAPIDAYLMTGDLVIFGSVLLGIWLYIILVDSIRWRGTLLLPVVPLIFWVLGRGLPHTMKLINNLVPWAWPLFVASGFPLVFLLSFLTGLLLWLRKG